MHPLLRITTATLLVILSGCALKGEMPAGKISERSVTVAVQADDTLSLQHIGTTAFNNVYATQKLPDWNFAVRLNTLSAQLLRSNNAFREVVEDNGTLSTAFSGATPLMNTSVWKIGDVEKLVASRSELCKTDYLLLMRTSTTGDHLSGTNQSLRGHGIHQRGFVGASNRAMAFVNMTALIIDCNKKAEAGNSFATGVSVMTFTLSKENNLQLSNDQIDLAKVAVERAAESAIQSVFTKLNWIASKGN
jgi:hypothetical protein